MPSTEEDQVTEIRQRVRSFVREELWPLEGDVIRRELEASRRTEPFQPEPGATYLFDPVGDLRPEDYQRLLEAARERGLWGIDVPAEYGGLGLTMSAKMAATEEMAKTIVPFVLPPDSPNLHWLAAACSAEQRERYLRPYARGEITSGIAITEPDAGSDVSAIQTRARREGDTWVLDGRKKWIGKADWANFLIVVAVTDESKGTRGGMTAFLVDRDTPGVVVERRLPTIANYRPCEVRFDGVRLAPEQVLGEVGQAFVPMQNRLSVRRLEIAARCVGATERLLDMLMDRAKNRVTFGESLASRQTVQNWIAEAGMGLHASRLINRDAAGKLDSGTPDIRFEASVAKVRGTELLNEVADHCLQAHGGEGLGKDLPIEHYYRLVRIWRVVEGASEIHRVTIARHLLRHGVQG